MKIIPYGKQYIDKQDIKFVVSALKKTKITTGNSVKNFEKKIKYFLGNKYSICCSSGTSALFIALQSIDLKKKDIIIMPSVNFVASYNAAKILGAKVFLADVDKFTGQMSPKNVLDCCNKFKLKRVKAVITMYNGGYPYNADKFKILKKKLKCYIIEDACHALGASYKSRNKIYKIGSCQHSDISTFSLHPLKSITTGEGGIVTTNNKKIYEKIERLRSLGIKRNNDKHWEYDVIQNGLNLRLTDFQSALGISQLKKIKSFILKRKKIFNYYNDKLKDIEFIRTPNKLKDLEPSYHLYLINLKERNKKIKEKLIKFMLKNNVMVQHHYIPIFKFKVFNDKYLGVNAKIYYNSSISLPIYYDLTIKQQNYIINLLKDFFNK
jgi:dTDP-4-amino-4,6-dideoxygalactose transaminase